jgi:hypothetical protein
MAKRKYPWEKMQECEHPQKHSYRIASPSNEVFGGHGSPDYLVVSAFMSVKRNRTLTIFPSRAAGIPGISSAE